MGKAIGFTKSASAITSVSGLATSTIANSHHASLNTSVTTVSENTPANLAAQVLSLKNLKRANHKIKTPLRHDKLEILLQGYNKLKKAYVVSGIKNGFRTFYNGPRNFSRFVPNLPTALNKPHEVDKIILKEHQKDFIMGPFDKAPLENFVCSPIAIIPKKDNTYRFIHNLSYPKKGDSINNFISHDDSTVQYETIDDVIRLVQKFGKGALMAKIDIKNAFRILPMHPDDFHLLGFHWRKKFFINCTLCMGLSTSCAIFESFSHCIQWIVQQRFPIGPITHILDDFMIFGYKDDSLCQNVLSYLLEICEDIKIPIKHEKTVYPTTIINAHGLEVDSIKMQLRLPDEKLYKCKSLIMSIINEHRITLKKLEQVVGLLCFACKAIRPGRTFLRRLYDLTIGVKEQHHFIYLNEESKKDLNMWLEFLGSYNGITMFQEASWSNPNIFEFYSDASGSIGFGAFSGNKWFAGQWPQSWNTVEIQTKEIYPIYLGLKIFGKDLMNKKLKIYCDNKAVVYILSYMTSKSKKVMTFVRLIMMELMKFNISIKPIHIAGISNRIADKLSRNLLQEAREEHPALQLSPILIPQELLPHNWIF